MKSIFTALTLLCAVSWQVHAEAKDTLRVATERDMMPSRVDYTRSVDNGENLMLAILVEGLLNTDGFGNLVPGQAQSWQASEDGLTYTFKLRPNLRWSDGHPVTAQNFVAAWRRVADPKYKNSIRDFLRPLKHFTEIQEGKSPIESLGVRAVDKTTLHVRLESPASYFEKLLAFHSLSPIPHHIGEAALDQMLSGDSDTLIVNGPYTLASKSDQRIVLKKNPHYWDKGQIHFEQVVFDQKDNRMQSALDVISGKADISFYPDFREVKWVRNKYPTYALEFPSSKVEYYWVNLDRTLLGAHPKLRRALSMSINREEICRVILEGFLTPALSFAPISMYKAKNPSPPDWSKLSYADRLTQAKQLIAEAGYTEASPLEIELKTESQESNQYTESVAIAISSMWRQIGVSTKIVRKSRKTLFTDLSEGNYQVGRAGWTADFHDPYNFLFLLGSGQGYYQGTQPRPEVDQWLRDSLSAVEIHEREGLYGKIEQSIFEHNPIIPIFHSRVMHIATPSLVPTQVFRYNILRWLMRRDSE